MNNFVSNYEVHLSHPNRSALVKFIKNYKEDVPLHFQSAPSKTKEEVVFSTVATASCEETGEFSFLDTLKKINDRAPLLEIGGSFIDNFGRGYIDSLCRKQYTKKYTSS